MNLVPLLLAFLCWVFTAAVRAETKPPAAEEPPTEWVEASGHRVVRLSGDGGRSSLYFHQHGYTASGDKLLISTRGGLSTIDLKTRQLQPLEDGRAGGVIVCKQTRQTFYVPSY